MRLRLIIISLSIICSINGFAQLDQKYYFGAKYLKEDSVPLIMFNPIAIYANRIFKNRDEAAKYYRLVYNVKKVYPLARICKLKIDDYNARIDGMSSSREKRQMLKKAEKELKQQFTPEIKNLTFTQGKILLKLIYRQTGDSSYGLIKEFRGSVEAAFWQFFAKMFGNDLKLKYDPYGDDKTIEDIVQLIESGII
jgi:hypothetical protein